MEEINGNGLQQQDEEDFTVALEIPLGEEAAKTFDFKKTVCSHGLFAMSPNQWDPISNTLSRPLRLSSHHSDSDSDSVLVSISHPSHLPHSLLVRVHATLSLSVQNRQSIFGQINRMLRLSDEDEKNVIEFKKILAMEEGGGEIFEGMKEFSGRLFRSPTLFEDMVKCILLCNCQWSRTLSMARALCELQLELQCQSCGCTKTQQSAESNNFIPKTPVGKESKRRKHRVSCVSTNLSTKLLGMKMDLGEVDTCLTADDAQTKVKNWAPDFSVTSIEDNSFGICKSCAVSSGVQSLKQRRIWNFPSPRELAKLDERFLSKRCGLGYRAGRIIKLSQAIVEGRIPMREFEVVCNGGSLNHYNKLADQLKEIDGFGPFTRANVLMCMGFYHVIPADSETMRHLKQVHAKSSTIQTVHQHIETIYGKYAPFQFLAYWAELWHFYEQKFGKFWEMPSSDYKLVTASNMRNKGSCKIKRAKIS